MANPKPMIENSAFEVLQAFNRIEYENFIVRFEKNVLSCHLLFWLLTTNKNVLIHTNIPQKKVIELMGVVAETYNRSLSIDDIYQNLKFSVEEITAKQQQKLQKTLYFDFSTSNEVFIPPITVIQAVQTIVCDSHLQTYYVNEYSIPKQIILFCDVPMVIGPTCSRKVGDLYENFFDSLSIDTNQESVNIIPVDQLLLNIIKEVKCISNDKKIMVDLSYRLSISNFYRIIDQYFSPQNIPEQNQIKSNNTYSFGGENPGGINVDHFELTCILEQCRKNKETESADLTLTNLGKKNSHNELLIYDNQEKNLPTIVIVNAFGMPIELFGPLSKALKENFRVITWQSRHVPAIDPCDDSLISVTQQVADLTQIVADLGDVKPIILGWCIGSQIAMEYVTNYPASISGLIIMNGIFAYSDMPETDWQTNLLSMANYASKNRKNAELSCKLMYATATPKKQDTTKNLYSALTEQEDILLGRYISQALRNPESLYRYSLFISRSRNREGYIFWDQFPKNTLLITGKNDKIASYKAAQMIQEKISHAKLFEFFDGNHYSFYSEPQNYAKVIQKNYS